MIVLSLVLGGKEAIEVSLDMKNQSYIEYTGHFESYSQTIKLNDQEDLKLLIEKDECPHGSFYGTVVYSERSKIVIDVVIDQDHSETFD
jgi:hypothetical protein